MRSTSMQSISWSRTEGSISIRSKRFHSQKAFDSSLSRSGRRKRWRIGNYDITFGVGNTLKADILQPHGGVHWAWFWRSLRAYENPILWMIKFLGRIFSPKQWVSGWVEDAPYHAKRLRTVIAISDMVKQDMMRWYRIPEERIQVVYNGVDIERFHPRNRRYREEIRRRHGIRR